MVGIYPRYHYTVKQSYIKMLTAEEGYRKYPYDCQTGKRVSAPHGKLTVGVGRNLEAKPLSDEVIALMLTEDIAEAEAACRVLYPHFEDFKDGRKLALVSMMFQLGAKGMLGFKKMNEAIEVFDWETAANEALKSKWAIDDTPERARRMAYMIRTGKNPYCSEAPCH